MKAHLGWVPPLLGERVLCGWEPKTLPKSIGDPTSLSNLCGNCRRVARADPHWSEVLDDLALRNMDVVKRGQDA